MKKQTSKLKNEPFDVSKLTTLQDLIFAAMGPPEKNIVNFKMVQAILMILAQQLRMLDRPVDYRSLEEVETAQSEREDAEGESEKLKRDGGEGTKAGSKTSVKDGKEKKAERESKKSEKDGEGEKVERKSKKSEKDGQGEKAERESKKFEKDGEGEKVERESKKSEKDGDGEKAERESKKSEKDGEREKKEGKSKKSEKDGEGKGKKAEGESEKLERDGGERKKAEKESEKLERDGGKGEKAKKESKKLERGKEGKAERESEKSESDGGEGKNSERESETSERGSEKSVTESEKSEKESEKAEREREKTGRDKEKAGQKKGKTEPEKEKTEKSSREKIDRDKEMTGPEREKTEREREVKAKQLIEDSFISVTDKDKVLVVETLPSSRRGSLQARVGSIPVVTLSQFMLLEAAVRNLEEKASPIPFPSMPDNKTLRDDIAKGNASLTDTMQAMQMSARVQAAEDAINRMAELLTDLTAKGTVPKDLPGKVKPSAAPGGADGKAPRRTKRAPSITSRARPSIVVVAPKPRSKSKADGQSVTPSEPDEGIPINFVTHSQMYSALSVLKDALMKSVNDTTSPVHKMAEQSRSTVIATADKAEVVHSIDDRIKYLTKLIDNHTQLLASTEDQVTTQLDAFNGQLGHVKNDLNDGMIQFEGLTGDTETQAVQELNEKYDNLVEMLDSVMDTHSDLVTGQSNLNKEMKGVLTCVEMLREEKSDRDEMLDRLQDKANISALEHLLPAKDYAAHQEKLKEQLGRCHGKFDRQETIWQYALRDLRLLADEKSDFIQLLKLKEDTENQLNEIQRKLRCLAYALGEPKAALLARQLSLGARCGSCNKLAIQDAVDKTYFTGAKSNYYAKPPRLPTAYFSYMGAGDPCEVETKSLTQEEANQHVCHRWVGGSHTLITPNVKRIAAEPIQSFEPPTKKYTQRGDDGRLYNMEELLAPCQDCNPQTEKELLVDGAGDTDHLVHVHNIRGPQIAEK